MEKYLAKTVIIEKERKNITIIIFLHFITFLKSYYSGLNKLKLQGPQLW